MSVGGFEWKYGRNSDEDFIRNYVNEDNDKGYILDVSVKYAKELHQLHSLSFLPKEWKLISVKTLVCNLIRKKNTMYTEKP